MCGHPAKFGCVDISLTVGRSVGVHTFSYRHAQLHVHMLN
jgi:hypothetical protein